MMEGAPNVWSEITFRTNSQMNYSHILKYTLNCRKAKIVFEQMFITFRTTFAAEEMPLSIK